MSKPIDIFKESFLLMKSIWSEIVAGKKKIMKLLAVLFGASLLCGVIGVLLHSFWVLPVAIIISLLAVRWVERILDE